MIFDNKKPQVLQIFFLLHIVFFERIYGYKFF